LSYILLVASFTADAFAGRRRSAERAESNPRRASSGIEPDAPAGGPATPLAYRHPWNVFRNPRLPATTARVEAVSRRRHRLTGCMQSEIHIASKSERGF